MKNYTTIASIFMIMFINIINFTISSTAGTLYSDGLAARVNGSIITQFDITRLTRNHEINLSKSLSAKEAMGKILAIRKSALATLIAEELIHQEFKSAGYQVPPTILESRIEKIIAETAGSDHQKFRHNLESQKLSYMEFKTNLEKSIAIEMMVSINVFQKIHITNQDIHECFTKNKEDYGAANSALIQVIYVNSEGKTKKEFKKKIQSINKKLTNGEDFGKLADEFSEFPDSPKAGSLGWMQIPKLRKDYCGAIKGLKKGEIAPCIVTETEAHFLKVADLINSKAIMTVKTKQKIKNKLKHKRSKLLKKEYIESLKENANIKIFDTREKN